jgi:AbrB family looped-hinge helix DNA binding protein
LQNLVLRLISCYDLYSYNPLNCKTMTTVSVSPKFQVVIPKEIREALHLFSGQRMEVRLNKGKVEFVPEKTILSYRGRWPGIDSTIVRDADRV